MLSYCKIHYGYTALLLFTYLPGRADTLGLLRFAYLVADAGSAYVRLQPPVQHEPSSSTNPARGADREMHPCLS
jgi:hypothetical protein